MNVIIGDVIEVITDVNAIFVELIRPNTFQSRMLEFEILGQQVRVFTICFQCIIDWVLPLEFYPKLKRSLRMHTGARSSPCPRSRLWHLLNLHINANT